MVPGGRSPADERTVDGSWSLAVSGSRPISPRWGEPEGESYGGSARAFVDRLPSERYLARAGDRAGASGMPSLTVSPASATLSAAMVSAEVPSTGI